MRRFVLDCSVAIPWIFKDEKNAYAESVLDAIATLEALVPQLWYLETANVLAMGERSGRITLQEGQEGKAFLQSLTVGMDSYAHEAAWDTILTLARRHRLTAYDAAYLELALRAELPLATLDKPLRKAAAACGVEIFKP